MGILSEYLVALLQAQTQPETGVLFTVGNTRYVLLPQHHVGGAMSLANVNENRFYHLAKMGYYSSLSWYHWRQQHFWRASWYDRLANYHSRKAKSTFMLG